MKENNRSEAQKEFFKFVTENKMKRLLFVCEYYLTITEPLCFFVKQFQGNEVSTIQFVGLVFTSSSSFFKEKEFSNVEKCLFQKYSIEKNDILFDTLSILKQNAFLKISDHSSSLIEKYNKCFSVFQVLDPNIANFSSQNLKLTDLINIELFKNTFHHLLPTKPSLLKNLKKELKIYKNLINNKDEVNFEYFNLKKLIFEPKQTEVEQICELSKNFWNSQIEVYLKEKKGR